MNLIVLSPIGSQKNWKISPNNMHTNKYNYMYLFVTQVNICTLENVLNSIILTLCLTPKYMWLSRLG